MRFVLLERNLDIDIDIVLVHITVSTPLPCMNADKINILCPKSRDVPGLLCNASLTIRENRKITGTIERKFGIAASTSTPASTNSKGDSSVIQQNLDHSLTFFPVILNQMTATKSSLNFSQIVRLR